MDFINKQQFAEFYQELFKEVISEYPEEERYKIGFDDEDIAEYSEWFAERINEDMRSYCNGDTEIIGNFANIQYDYQRKFGKSYLNVLNELNGDKETDNTREFKEWVLDWFVYAFGTFGIKYNIDNNFIIPEIEEYDREHDNESAA